jgi:serralysin
MALNIHLEFDAAAMAAPASFRAGIQAAASILNAAISTPITVNIIVQYGENGIASTGAQAGPDNGLFENYSTVRGDLIANAAPGDTTFNALPGGSTIQGQSQVAVWNAQLKAFGLLAANANTDDGSADFGTAIPQSLLVGVALHELTHALGRIPYAPQPDIFDFYRFTGPGIRLFDQSIPAPAAYFSLDGGNTRLADFGRSSDPSDFLNNNLTTQDPFNEFYDSSTFQHLTQVDLQLLDALGFNTTLPPQSVVIQTDVNAFGLTSFVAVANQYALENSSGNGPHLQLNGAPVVAGQLAPWSPIGAALTATGYEVAWKLGNEFVIWNVDSNGNYLSGSGGLSGNSTALESYEYSFHQDLNGDGTIGVISTVIHTDTNSVGTTSLVAVADQYALENSSGNGPHLQLNGAPVVAGQLAPWSPIGAAPTATGYEVAWKLGNEFVIWNTDSNGNYLSGSGGLSGQSYALESYEYSFRQDLNGDGTIGVTSTVIHTDTNSFGTTSLVAVADQYALENSSGNGPHLQLNGAPVVAGQLSPWSLIGAAPTATGYEVAWQLGNEFVIWNTDSNGNYLSGSGGLWGQSTALGLYESSFNQDLDGDGVIGVPSHGSPAGASLSGHELVGGRASGSPLDDGSGRVRSLVDAMSTMFPSAIGAGHDAPCTANALLPEQNVRNFIAYPTQLGLSASA